VGGIYDNSFILKSSPAVHS